MSTIPTNEAYEARAGLTWQWRREDLTADYPASAWGLTYWFKKSGATGANFSVAATADGDFFAVSVPASTTEDYVAGSYTWVAIASAAGEAFEVDKGTLNLLPRYDQAADLDDRSHARIMLDAIEAMLQGRASHAQKSYTIGSASGASRAIEFFTPDELEMWRIKYRAEVRAEDMAEGKITHTRLLAQL